MDTGFIELAMETIGWIGAVSLLSAYYLISNGKLDGKSILYQGLNLIGSLGILINSYYHNALPPVVLNIIWSSIGIYSLAILLKNKRRSATNDNIG